VVPGSRNLDRLGETPWLTRRRVPSLRWNVDIFCSSATGDCPGKAAAFKSSRPQAEPSSTAWVAGADSEASSLAEPLAADSISEAETSSEKALETAPRLVCDCSSGCTWTMCLRCGGALGGAAVQAVGWVFPERRGGRALGGVWVRRKVGLRVLPRRSLPREELRQLGVTEPSD
jgi:hypothetical protein